MPDNIALTSSVFVGTIVAIKVVVKYRALEDSPADSAIEYKAGATLFVMGDEEKDGKVMVR